MKTIVALVVGGFFVVSIGIVAIVGAVGLGETSSGQCVPTGVSVASPSSGSESSDRLYVPSQYVSLVNEAAAGTGLSAPLLAGVFHQESGWSPRAVSRAGASGLGQLMPATARGLGVTDPFDPEQNIDGSARYLAAQLREFGSIDLALAAYNAGPGTVRRYRGVPPYRETVSYVSAVKAFAQRYGGSTELHEECLSGLVGSPPTIVGGAACPVGQPNRFSNDWHASRGGGTRLHEGLDIFADRSTPIFAYQGGVVRRTSSRLGGISLWITTEGGDRYYHAHLSAYAQGTETGKHVDTGQVIGYVGNTGNARTTPPHLHWEVHPSSSGRRNPIPPYPLAVAVCRAE